VILLYSILQLSICLGYTCYACLFLIWNQSNRKSSCGQLKTLSQYLFVAALLLPLIVPVRMIPKSLFPDAVRKPLSESAHSFSQSVTNPLTAYEKQKLGSKRETPLSSVSSLNYSNLLSGVFVIGFLLGCIRLFIQRSMANFEKLPNLEKKRLVQAVVKKVIIKRGENGDNLILHVCLDPSRPHQREIVRIPVGQHQDGAYSVEYKSSGFDVNGGGYTIVVEPRVLIREYEAKWLKARINLGELASLRREGWKTRDLAKRYGVSLSAVKMALFRLG